MGKIKIKDRLMILSNDDNDNFSQCISCYEETCNVVMCCHAPVCRDCYVKWLENKRQCMHCKRDQCSFEIWASNYRKEPEVNDQMNDELIQYMTNVIAGLMPEIYLRTMLNSINNSGNTDRNPNSVIITGTIYFDNQPNNSENSRQDDLNRATSVNIPNNFENSGQENENRATFRNMPNNFENSRQENENTATFRDMRNNCGNRQGDQNNTQRFRNVSNNFEEEGNRLRIRNMINGVFQNTSSENFQNILNQQIRWNSEVNTHNNWEISDFIQNLNRENDSGELNYFSIDRIINGSGEINNASVENDIANADQQNDASILGMIRNIFSRWFRGD